VNNPGYEADKPHRIFRRPKHNNRSTQRRIVFDQPRIACDVKSGLYRTRLHKRFSLFTSHDKSFEIPVPWRRLDGWHGRCEKYQVGAQRFTESEKEEL
jgi:hypothetical protein